MNKRVLRTLINEQGLWEDEMLPTFQTITILVHLGGSALSEPRWAGIWWWGLGDWDLFFSLPIDLTWENRSEDGPSLASKPRACFPVGSLSWDEAPLQSFREFGQQENPGLAVWFLLSSRWG